MPVSHGQSTPLGRNKKRGGRGWVHCHLYMCLNYWVYFAMLQLTSYELANFQPIKLHTLELARHYTL